MDNNGINTFSSEEAKKRKITKLLLGLIIVLSFLIIIIVCIRFFNYYTEQNHTEEMVDTIYNVANIKEIVPPTTTSINSDIANTTTITNIYSKYGNSKIYNINFNNLKEINADTVGWIKVEGTNINYPYVQTNDNQYYLKHSFDKKYNKQGWVFLDYRNKGDEKNTILYAHGLMNNQMFGSMRKVIKPSWYNNKNNHIITTVTIDGTQKWQVFSTYTIGPESYYISVDFKTDEEYLKFLTTIKNRSVYDYNVNVNTDDKILTLSSCYDNKKRMVLHAKLISN